MKKRVVVTGLGVVHSLGTNLETFWNAVKEGKNGIKTITKFDTSDYSTKVGAQIDDFDATQCIDKKEAKRMDLFTQYSIYAAQEAVTMAGIDFSTIDPYRAGVLVGSGIGGIETLEDNCRILFEKGPKRISPFFVPMMIANMASGQIAIKFGLKGYNACVVTACATANHSIGDAMRVIQNGYADIMISGGAEASITPLGFSGFCSMRAMSENTDPKTASRPFDKNRDGFVMGEGAGILVLEEYEHAVKRGAKIFAELVGYGCTCDAYHITAPDPEGDAGVKCLQLALEDAGVTPDKVGYVNAHGTSTPLNDPLETRSIKKVFGPNIVVSSTKSMTGHLLGAAGGIEAIISIMAMRDSFLPPTINLHDPDPECDLDYVPNQGRKKEIEYALSNALGFGGHNGALLFKKY
ncbi:MAG: beta-ketoacyl-ACP synthase II [Clostridiaceae bacterium]|jgi:3-oxoacyl-[acyl-carrier-protein] synthase II|nr:beta-ketoacyl-ACP synthase II [Clostridiaceae bacterium]